MDFQSSSSLCTPTTNDGVRGGTFTMPQAMTARCFSFPLLALATLAAFLLLQTTQASTGKSGET